MRASILLLSLCATNLASAFDGRLSPGALDRGLVPRGLCGSKSCMGKGKEPAPPAPRRNTNTGTTAGQTETGIQPYRHKENPSPARNLENRIQPYQAPSTPPRQRKSAGPPSYSPMKEALKTQNQAGWIQGTSRPPLAPHAPSVAHAAEPQTPHRAQKLMTQDHVEGMKVHPSSPGWLMSTRGSPSESPMKPGLATNYYSVASETSPERKPSLRRRSFVRFSNY